jgi:hypothetical protein
MALTDSLKSLFVETARSLQGRARQLFMARPVKELGVGGQRRAARERGRSRVPLRPGRHELERGFRWLDAVAARGRKRAEAPLPSRLTALKAIVARQSQTAPQCRTARRSPRLSAAAVRRQRIVQPGSPDAALPTVQPRTTPRLGLLAPKGREEAAPPNARNGRHLRADTPDPSGG